MEIQVDIGTKKRKALAQAVGEIVGAEAVYKGSPSYAFVVGESVTVERDSTLTVAVAQVKDATFVNRLLEGLTNHGFEAQIVEPAENEMAEPPAETPEVTPTAESPPSGEETPATAEPVGSAAEHTGFTIQLPLNGFNPATLDNLSRLIAAKGNLICKALAVTELPVAIGKETVDFPWFDRELSQGEITAYTHFLSLLAEMAKRQSRVLAVEKEVENEKYAFRCFLLRLNMIGAEYGESRRILLRNLTGNGSMRSGEHKPPKPKQPPAEAPEPPAAATEPQAEPEPPPKGTSRFKKILNTLGIF